MSLTKKISITILDEMMLNKSIDEKNYKKVLYGFEIIISVLFQIVGLVTLGVLFGILDRMIPVAFSFALLRLFAGGYHADTCFKCFILTFVMCVGGIKLGEFVSKNIIGMIVMSVVSLAIIVMLAPADTSRKRMTERGRSINRKRSIMILVILSSVAFSLYANSLIDMLHSALIISGLFVESLSLLIKTN